MGIQAKENFEVEEMFVSVIIPTYNGAHKLPALLDALQKQTYNEFELIVAIDGSTDNTDEVLKTYTPFFKSVVKCNRPCLIFLSNSKSR